MKQPFITQEDNVNRSAKIISPFLCPHCSKEIMIAQTSFLPTLDWVLTREDLNKAKEKVIKQIEGMDVVDEQSRTDLLEYINKSDVLFSPAEIPSILQLMPKPEPKLPTEDGNEKEEKET